MILKKCIQSLLSTRTTKKEASVQFLPKSTVHSSGSTSGWGNVFVSPINGWLVAVSKGACSLKVTDGAKYNSIPGQRLDAVASVPVKKGQEVGIETNATETMTYSWLETLGGVKHLFAPCFRFAWQEV